MVIVSILWVMAQVQHKVHQCFLRLVIALTMVVAVAVVVTVVVVVVLT